MRNRIFRLFVVTLGVVALTSCNLFKKDDEDLLYNDFDFEIDGIAYNFVDEGVEVVAKTQPSNYSNEIIIPSEVVFQGIQCEVVGVGENAFAGSKVTSVTLPSTIRYLGRWCFQVCDNLKSLQLPKGLIYIDSYCFERCKNLKSLQLPKGLQSIGSDAFRESGLESITIPDSVTYMGSWGTCPQLKSIIIDSSKTLLETWESSWFATYGACDKLESIFIGRNLDVVKGYGIWNHHGSDYSACSNLKKVVIGEFVTEFGASFESTLEIVCEPTSPPKASGECSPKCLQISTLYVPQSAIELYREDAYWGRFKNIKALED